MPQMRLNVKGMHCPSCKMLIEDELEEMGAKNIMIDFDPVTQEGSVICEHDDDATIMTAIRDLGEYQVSK